jgi:aspartate/methionine/tyrosine aminotransferase
MRHPSSYLDWYVHVPPVEHDFRSSGLTKLILNIDLPDIDMSANYIHGNPETAKILAKRYQTEPENVFISSEGASGQNTRIIRMLAERNPRKNEAIVEYPTYEPLLRQTQEHFKKTKRLDRKENEDYQLDADKLRRTVSPRTGLLVLTNPHAPSGATIKKKQFEEIATIAQEHDFFVFCDEIYAEFDRAEIPTSFSIDPEKVIVTSSFTKAYGLGGLKLGVALASKMLVDELYLDVLNTVGNSPNIVQLIASELLGKHLEKLEKHKNKWNKLKKDTEKWLAKESIEYFPNKSGVTYWIKIPTRDTCEWINKIAVPKFGLAPVPGAFFLFKNGIRLEKSNMIRLGLGNLDPENSRLEEAFLAFEKSLKLG